MNNDKRARVCQEGYGSSGTQNVVYYKENDSIMAVQRRWTASFTMQFVNLFTSVFLPQGFPESVSKDYLDYQMWDTFQAFISTVMGTVSTQAVLTSIGVGDENATPLAATITWLIRDGTSMSGRIIFAWKQGSALDYDSKQWRLFADFVNDIAFGFDLVAPHVGSLSTAIICVSGVCRALCSVAGGATRAAFVQHQAKRGNLADVAAKDGSQETMISLFGLIVSVIVLPFITGNNELIWFLYCIFVCLHLFVNYKAVRSIVMNTLNQSRLCILVENFMENSGRLPSLKETNLLEPVVVDEVYITLHKDSDNRTLLESSFQAQLLLCHLQNKSKPIAPYGSKLNGQLQTEKISNKLDLLNWSRTMTQDKFPAFLKVLEANGWETNHNLLGADEWRAEWKYHD